VPFSRINPDLQGTEELKQFAPLLLSELFGLANRVGSFMLAAKNCLLEGLRFQITAANSYHGCSSLGLLSNYEMAEIFANCRWTQTTAIG
jgi:hypothetical protein